MTHFESFSAVDGSQWPQNPQNSQYFDDAHRLTSVPYRHANRQSIPRHFTSCALYKGNRKATQTLNLNLCRCVCQVAATYSVLSCLATVKIIEPYPSSRSWSKLLPNFNHPKVEKCLIFPNLSRKIRLQQQTIILKRCTLTYWKRSLTRRRKR